MLLLIVPRVQDCIDASHSRPGALQPPRVHGASPAASVALPFRRYSTAYIMIDLLHNYTYSGSEHVPARARARLTAHARARAAARGPLHVADIHAVQRAPRDESDRARARDSTHVRVVATHGTAPCVTARCCGMMLRLVVPLHGSSAWFAGGSHWRLRMTTRVLTTVAKMQGGDG